MRMKVVVVLQRVGRTRVSRAATPITARVFQDGRYGEQLLKDKITDVGYAKDVIQTNLDHQFHAPVEITWIDRTEEPGN